MNVKTFKVGYLQTNCYIITDEKQSEAVIIDPGGGYEKIINYLDANKKKASAVLLTHGHFDHILAVRKLQKDGARVYIHNDDKNKLLKGKNLSEEMGLSFEKTTPDVLIEDGDIINIGNLSFKVIHTPGHSKGSCSFVIEDCIFTGDTLFLGSYGRTDFLDGSMEELQKSLYKLFNLKGDYKVYPGHDDSTTLEYERKFNPIS